MATRAKELRLSPVRSLPWALAAGLELLVLLLAEARMPLRPPTERKSRRVARNAAIAAGAGLANAALERELVGAVARAVVRRRIGILQWLRPRESAETAVAVVLLDWALYGWHVATHQVPALWRFHRVQHADADLDVTTAVRFHFGEMALSVPARAAAVAALGVSPRAFSLWQHLLVLSIQFHHANVRLPRRIERALSWLVMTPRLHGVHHAREAALRGCNWSSGLAAWDVLHGTRRSRASQPAIGVASVGADLGLGRMLALPFREAERGP